MPEERNEKDFKAIDSILNNMGFDARAVAEKLAHNHPTLQQSFMRLVTEFIRAEAQNTGVDGRNEATALACRKLIKLIEDENMYFPTI